MANAQIQLSFQVCPIILTGGIAGQVAGGMLPVINLFYPNDPSRSTLGLPFDIGKLDDAFGAFNVLPGGTLVSQTIGKYPFANQYVAANAVIEEPLTLSVIMDAPMRGPNAWNQKNLIMSTLKSTLDKHNSLGGLYTVATPAYLYQNMILVALTDNSRGGSPLPQNAWRFDFEKPLVALSDLQGAQNQLMGKMTLGVPAGPAQSGVQPGVTTGQTTLSKTYKTAGGLSGGSPPNYSSSRSVATNFPAIINPGGSPFQGVG